MLWSTKFVPTIGMSRGQLAGTGNEPGTAFTSWSMVWNCVVASTVGALTLKYAAAMLFGYWLIMNCLNCGVSIVLVEDETLEDERSKIDPKKNVRFLMMGPPNVPPNSLRRAAGKLTWEIVRACK